MRTLFTTGIQSPRHTFWMGQQSAYVATTPESRTTAETSVADIIAQGFESAADIYGSYGDIQEAEAAAEGRAAEAAAKEAAARTSQIMQQTQLLQQQALEKQQGSSMATTALYVGGGLLALLAVGGTIYLLAKK